MAQPQTYVFEDGRLIPTHPREPEVLVADSFVLAGGQAVGMHRHISRFSENVRATAGLSQAHIQAFVDASVSAMPRQGEWFPRLECVRIDGARHLRYVERICPARFDTATLARATHDPRNSPTVKGPDLKALGALRNSVSALGANEALIVDAEDNVVEGAWSSVVVWSEDGTFLDLPPASFPRLPSVTESIVVEIARLEGVTIRETATSVGELAGREVWILSALHGVRQVQWIVDGPTLTTGGLRWAHYREAWWNRRLPLDDNS